MFSDPILGLQTSPESPFGILAADREEILNRISKQSRFDVVVIGGGIHGAVFARLAAFNGLKTLLLERADYASGTSSRSSKMAHGGLRYLEMLDIAQVYEGIKAREDLFQTASQLVKPQEFLLPIFGDTSKIKIGFGLWLYDQMARIKERRHRWISRAAIKENPFDAPGRNLRGAYRYFDGLMRDTRLVIENVVAARQEGASCLNYARVDSLSSLKHGGVTIGWTDTLSGKRFETEAGVIVNCAGPWVAEVGRISPSELAQNIRFSQGTHLLFEREWNGPALFLPMEEKNRYYWIWPHFAGTLVGTTEREVKSVPEDPQPTAAEVEEILSRLRRDVPGSGLDRSSLHYAFAGIRTLPLRAKKGSSVAALSRKHIWSVSGGTLTLVGGKFTTAAWTAFEGLKIVFSLAGLSQNLVPLTGRLLPGAALFKESVENFNSTAAKRGVPAHLRMRAIQRLGSNVRFLLSDPAFLEPVANQVLSGEIKMALRVEQAETMEDLMRRRLELEYLPNHGRAVLDVAAAQLREHRPETDTASQITRYNQRLKDLEKILKA